MLEVGPNPVLTAPYGAAEPLIAQANAGESGAQDTLFDNSSSKYELLPSRRPMLRAVVDRWVAGNRQAFNPDYVMLDERIDSVVHQTYVKRRELMLDAQQFFLDTRSECLAQKRCYAHEVADVPGQDAGARFLGLLDDKPGLVLGEGGSGVGARKFLIENMLLLKERGVQRLYMDRLLTDVHGGDIAELNESPHNQMSLGLANYLHQQDDVRRVVSKLPSEVVNKYSLMAVMEAARLAGIRVVAIDCAAGYFLKGGDRGDDHEAWRIPVMNYFSYLVLSETEDDRNQVSQDGPNGKWVALVGNAHMSEFDGVPGLSELMGVPAVRFEDARENRIDVDAGFEVDHAACFLGDKKNIRVKGDFVFKVDVQQGNAQQGNAQPVIPQPVTPQQATAQRATAQRATAQQATAQQPTAQQPTAHQKATRERPNFLSRAWDYLSRHPGAQRV